MQECLFSIKSAAFFWNIKFNILTLALGEHCVHFVVLL